MIPFAKPQIGLEERQAVIHALDNDRLTEGPLAKQFEADWSSMFGGYALTVTSCTAALYLAMLWYKRQLDGAQISMPAMTHVATAHAATAFGLTIRFLDCDENGRTDSPICGVSFLGAPAKGLIQDFACGVGLKAERVACYSFYPAKHMTTGEGGMIVTNDPKIASFFERARAFGKVMKDGKFDVISHGLNFRMSEINAAIGIEQLKKLPKWLEVRKANWNALAQELPKDLRVLDTSGGAYYALCAYVPDGVDRDTYRAKLLQSGIETSVYYPVPVPHLSYYKEAYGHRLGDFPNAEKISARSLCFPIGPHIGQNELEQIVTAAKGAL